MTAARSVTATFNVAVVSAPVLKWQYGGCLPGPYCQTGWYSSPAVTDLDGDGQPDVIWGAYDVVALRGDSGSLKWRAPSGNRVWPGIAVADMTGDGFKELFVPGGHYVNAFDRNGNQLTVNPIFAPRQFWSEVGVHVDQAVDLRGYANCGVDHRPSFDYSAPVVTDVDGDGVPELIVVGNIYNCGTAPYTSLYHMPFIFRLDRTRWSGSGFDWTVIPTPGPGSAPRSEEYNVIEMVFPHPAVADLAGDGFKEIIYPSYY